MLVSRNKLSALQYRELTNDSNHNDIYVGISYLPEEHFWHAVIVLVTLHATPV
jgi:hypothetical protein